jgi:hypothetical protein
VFAMRLWIQPIRSYALDLQSPSGQGGCLNPMAPSSRLRLPCLLCGYSDGLQRVLAL